MQPGQPRPHQGDPIEAQDGNPRLWITLATQAAVAAAPQEFREGSEEAAEGRGISSSGGRPGGGISG